MMNKKGFELFADIAALFILAFIIFLIIIFLYNPLIAGQEQLIKERGEIEDNLDLLNYLRTEDNDVKISDLVNLRDRDLLKEKTEEIFNNLCFDYCFWKLEIIYTDENMFFGNIVTEKQEDILEDIWLYGFNKELIKLQLKIFLRK